MKDLDPQLRQLFDAARPARQARIDADDAAPFGFASRIASLNPVLAPDPLFLSWARFSRWGLGFACGLMFLSIAFNRNLLNAEWSPALTVADQVSQIVSLR